ncbi:hypothetical protein [Nocardia jiangxiensis]|uniref:hypothetical protein n=1 Tax=Nocardia jiangxiensis TaxID=282685 RepID=UPI0002FC8742|nr:hypothetical protein [Nocardia jiangxiensis]
MIYELQRVEGDHEGILGWYPSEFEAERIAEQDAESELAWSRQLFRNEIIADARLAPNVDYPNGVDYWIYERQQR